MILNHTINHIPNLSKQFYAQTDASKNAIGFFLFQKDEQGNTLPTAACSRILTKTEQNYSTYRKKILAILYGLKAIDIFIRFGELQIQTDCRSILYLRMAKGNNEVLQRYAIEL